MRPAWLLFPLLISLAACGSGTDPAESEADLVGVWVLDVEAFRTSFVRMVESEIHESAKRGTLPPEDADLMRTNLLQEVHDRFSSMWAWFTLRADGSFESEGSDGTLSGIWYLHGVRLSLIVEVEKGVRSEEPATWSGTVEAGAIRLRPEPEKDYEITLRPGSAAPGTAAPGTADAR